MSALPPGFVMDGEPAPAVNLPAGFVVDETAPSPTAPAPAMRPPDSGLSRFVQGVADPLVGIGQKFAHLGAATGFQPLVDNAATYDDFVKQRETDYSAPEGMDWARTGGNVASPLNLAAGVRATQFASKLPLLQRILAASPVGAALGLTQPVTQGDFGDETAKQAKFGAALGPAAEVVGAGASRVIAPAVTDAARKLMGEGVRLTPGQMLGGWVKGAEDKAMSLPILGDAIRGARVRSVDDFNKAAANRVLGPIGQKVPDGLDAGRSLVAHVQDTVGQAYDNLVPKLRFDVADPAFISEMQAFQQAARTLPATEAQQFQNIIQRELGTRLQAGKLDGADFKAAESALSAQARKFGATTDGYQQELGDILGDVVDSMRSGLTRSNPQHAAELAAINRAYANLVRYEGAAAMRGAKEGVVSPANLGAAVRSTNQSVRKRQVASGKALMQDLSDAGESTIPSQIPDSGTAGRLALGGLLGGAAGGVPFTPNILGALLAGGSLYTRPGQAVLQTLIAGGGPTRNMLAQIPQRAALPAASGLIPLAYQGSE